MNLEVEWDPLLTEGVRALASEVTVLSLRNASQTEITVKLPNYPQ